MDKESEGDWSGESVEGGAYREVLRENTLGGDTLREAIVDGRIGDGKTEDEGEDIEHQSCYSVL